MDITNQFCSTVSTCTSIAQIMLRRLPSNSNPKWPHISIIYQQMDYLHTLSSDGQSTCTHQNSRYAHSHILINLGNVMTPCCEDDPLIMAVICLHIELSEVFHLFVK